MAQEPYTGVPQVSPELRPTPYREEATPIAAFGGLTAEATEKLGGTLQQAGRELYARAYALEELHHAALADEQTTNYVMQGGQLYADYQSQLGKNAVDGFQAFQDRLSRLREEIGANLSPFARRLYDQQTRSEQARLMNAAARHAADQGKAFVVQSLDARAKSIDAAALAQPMNEAEFQDNLKKKEDAIRGMAGPKGWSDDVLKEKLQQARTDLYVNRLQGIAKTEPMKARQMADEAIARGDIRNPEASNLLDYINRHAYTVGARNVSNTVMSGNNLRFGAGIVPIEQAMKAIKAIEGGNYSIRGQLVPATKSHPAGYPLGAYQVMDYNLKPWLKEAGMKVMEPDDFIKDVDAQDELFRRRFGGYMKKTGSFNEAALMWFGHGAHDPLGTTPQKYLAVTNAALAKNSSLGDLVNAGKDQAEQLMPNDPIFGYYVEQHIREQFNLEKSIQQDAELRRKDLTDRALLGEMSNGQVPKTLGEMKRISPDLEATIDSMSSRDQIELQQRIQNVNARLTKQTQNEVYYQLNGLLYSENPDDVQKFLNTDVTKLGLSKTDMAHFLREQRRLIKEGGGDPSTMAAMRLIEPIVRQSIPRSDKKSEVLFRGAFVREMQDWKMNNPNKPFTDVEAKQIALRLLLHEHPDRWLWFKGPRLFELDLPKEEKDRLKALNITPEEMEERREEWVHKVYRLLALGATGVGEARKKADLMNALRGNQ